MKQSLPCSVGWLQDANEASDLARFFVQNISPDYISHSELQGARTNEQGAWSTGLVDIIRTQIEQGTCSGVIRQDVDSCPVFVAKRGNKIVGIGMLSIFPTAPVPYAVIEDLVVDQGARGAGILLPGFRSVP